MHGNQSWELQHPLCVLNVNAGAAQGMRTPEAGFLKPEFRPLLAEDDSQRFLVTHSTDLSMSTQSPALWFHCASSLLCCLKDGEPSNWMSLGSQKGSCPSFEGHISRRGSLAQSISLFWGFTMAAPSLRLGTSCACCTGQGASDLGLMEGLQVICFISTARQPRAQGSQRNSLQARTKHLSQG